VQIALGGGLEILGRVYQKLVHVLKLALQSSCVAAGLLR